MWKGKGKNVQDVAFIMYLFEVKDHLGKHYFTFFYGTECTPFYNSRSSAFWGCDEMKDDKIHVYRYFSSYKFDKCNDFLNTKVRCLKEKIKGKINSCIGFSGK